MAIEIERKFLVRGDSWRAQAYRAQPMRQGYLVEPGGRASVRVRVVGEHAHLNIKAAIVGSARAEYEYEIPLADAEPMLASLCIGRVDKVRHYLEHDGRTWEIDVFEGDNAGLVVAEIELEDEEASFTRPAWVGDEVTDDARYYNHALAQTPYTRWP
ncbi:CYTH domain-containing protein [Algiphilus sp. W345]|uniref:CYTH domain-containing protein n=1 Tax=Banduia mediterranea TaxID=3075609 RepID=A0ABU2WI65_9GAMM|nr:CYTH domain-containing protein [Algiphilus sp. W345]MDT0497573.1 CYTH domain-containing protein [Algiphilus sp. W345]